MMLAELRTHFPYGVALVTDSQSTEEIPQWESDSAQVASAKTASALKIRHEVDGSASVEFGTRSQMSVNPSTTARPPWRFRTTNCESPPPTDRDPWWLRASTRGSASKWLRAVMAIRTR